MSAQKLYASQGATSVPANTVKGSPVAGPTVDCSLPGQSAILTCSISNANGVLGAPCIVVAQTSGDGTTWRDFVPVSGDLLSGSLYSFTVRLPPEAKYGRWIAYNNTTNAVVVTFESTVYSPS